MAIKISELINFLENIKREYGDLPVFTSGVGYAYDRVDIEVDKLRITNQKEYINDNDETRLEIG